MLSTFFIDILEVNQSVSHAKYIQVNYYPVPIEKKKFLSGYQY